MLIHAFKRNADEKPVIDFAGLQLAFKANARGHVVCDVPDEVAPSLLAAAGCGLREYNPDSDAAPASAVKKQAEPVKSFVITPSDGPAVDLGAMDDAAVRAFAEAEGLAKPHHTKKGDALRQHVIDALKAE